MLFIPLKTYPSRKAPRIFNLLLTALITAWLGALAPAVAQPVKTTADFAVIMDYETGEVLFEKNARTPTAPASMSKLMTTAIVFERLKEGTLSLSDKFSVSEKAWRMGGSKMWVRVDTEIELANLLRGVIIQSGNDACIVIAENISGSEDAFAELMNAKAREWGLNDSTFANATGWPHPDHKMSTRDLALLARKIISEYSEFYQLFAETEFTWEKIRQPNRNPLLTVFDGADGLKTGRTDESGFGLVGSAIKGDARRILVLNGLESARERNSESARLLRLAFNDFGTKVFYPAESVVGDASVFKGKSKTIPLIVKDQVDLLLHRSLHDTTKATVVYTGPVSAPIAAGQQIGYLRVVAESGNGKEYPLYAGASVAEVGFFGKVSIAARKLFLKPDRSQQQQNNP